MQLDGSSHLGLDRRFCNQTRRIAWRGPQDRAQLLEVVSTRGWNYNLQITAGSRPPYRRIDLCAQAFTMWAIVRSFQEEELELTKEDLEEPRGREPGQEPARAGDQQPEPIIWEACRYGLYACLGIG